MSKMSNILYDPFSQIMLTMYIKHTCFFLFSKNIRNSNNSKNPKSMLVNSIVTKISIIYKIWSFVKGCYQTMHIIYAQHYEPIVSYDLSKLLVNRLSYLNRRLFTQANFLVETQYILWSMWRAQSLRTRIKA